MLTITRRLMTTVAIVAHCGVIGGCSDLEWNRDLDWWKAPRRTIRPIRPIQPAPKNSPAGPSRRADRSDEQGPGVAGAPVAAAEDRALPGRPVGEDSRGRELVVAGERPFHSLYLVSGNRSTPAGSVDDRCKLHAVRARLCATVLEKLYVPMGRSGSDDESYLMYEDLAEYHAAKALAPALDLPPASADPSTIADDTALRAGIGLYYQVLSQGPIVEPVVVERCERRLAEAAQSSRLPARLRWVAGILGGRLASDYRYDYASARRCFHQAADAMPEDSIERMTARWWLADAWAEEGRREEAEVLWRSILAEHGPRHPMSHIPRQARQRLDRKHKR